MPPWTSKTSQEFLPLVFDVFCGTAPRVDEFLRRLASRRRDTEDRIFRRTQLLPQLRHPSSQVAESALAYHQ
jgi:hypothetical protein